MAPSGELVVNAAGGHFFEGSLAYGREMLFFGLLVTLEEEVHGRGVGEFRSAAKAAVLDIKKLSHGLDLRADDTEVEIGAGASENFGLRDGVGKRVGGTREFGPLVAVGIGYGEKNAAK